MFTNTIRSALRARVVPTPRIANVMRSPMIRSFPNQVRLYSDHHEETFEEFTARYVKNLITKNKERY